MDISEDQKSRFWKDGFLIFRGLFDAEETDYLLRAYQEDEAIQKRAVHLSDGRGGQTEIALWNEAGEDVFGAVARCARMVDAAEALIGDEVYHYHSKINVKRPEGGGVWLWHQDYGYWYSNGCLFPDMLTAAVPLTPMNSANGCLQVIPGSNRMGRLDHLRIAQQTGADPDRVDAILTRSPPRSIRSRTGRRHVLPLQHSPYVRPEPISGPPQPPFDRIQHPTQRPRPRPPASPVFPNSAAPRFRSQGARRASGWRETTFHDGRRGRQLTGVP